MVNRVIICILTIYYDFPDKEDLTIGHVARIGELRNSCNTR
jgi:hypothetical protein